MSGGAGIKAAWVTLLVGFAALVASVVTAPAHFLYDEPAYVNYVTLLKRHGLSEDFLDSLTGAAGPLYAFVHAALEPITQLQPLRMRLVNVALLVVVAGILAAWLKRRNCPDYLLASGSVLVVPMTWVIAGMALTEMPAMAFATLSLYLQLRGVEALEEGRGRVMDWFIASAICLGVAVWGRQPYLALMGVPVLLGLLDRRLREPTLVFVAIVTVAAMLLVIAWEDLLPPKDDIDFGISPVNGLVSLGYTGICFFLLAPRLTWLSRKSVIAAAIALVAANGWADFLIFYPLRPFVERLLPASLTSLYGIACGSVLLIAGVFFFVWMLRVTWLGRADLKQVTINAGLLCMALSPMLIANYFSSRYTAMALPYLILAAQPWREWRLTTNMTAIAGCGVGFACLYGYLAS